MILQRSGNETWLGAAHRFAELEGYPSWRVTQAFGLLVDFGYTEKRAAYLVLAKLGMVDDVR